MIIDLDMSHADAVRHLFYLKNYMGADIKQAGFYSAEESVTLYHEAFCETYLSGLNNYKSVGYFKDEKCLGAISYYISPDEPSWYGTQIRSIGGRQVVRDLLDAVIQRNEEDGRFKFYTLWSAEHVSALRKFAFNKETNERYDYYDEYYVPAQHKCLYINHWHVLFNRVLLPIDTVVRCTFLKKQYRTLPKGGNI